jgi:hypothetical protein
VAPSDEKRRNGHRRAPQPGVIGDETVSSTGDRWGAFSLRVWLITIAVGAAFGAMSGLALSFFAVKAWLSSDIAAWSESTVRCIGAGIGLGGALGVCGALSILFRIRRSRS